jgi:hypothetical protein
MSKRQVIKQANTLYTYWSSSRNGLLPASTEDTTDRPFQHCEDVGKGTVTKPSVDTGAPTFGAPTGRPSQHDHVTDMDAITKAAHDADSLTPRAPTKRPFQDCLNTGEDIITKPSHGTGQDIVTIPTKRVLEAAFPEEELPSWPINTRPSSVGKKKKMGTPETILQKALIDQLYIQYRNKTDHDNLRCLIKLLLDPLWLEGRRAQAFSELDSYAGGPGSTQTKLEAALRGEEVDLIPGQCLARAKPTPRNGYDHTTLSSHCSEHNTQHKWFIQRGFFDAILIGRFDNELEAGAEYPIMDLILTFHHASHICHNKPCSDPFHVERERDYENNSRNFCRPPHNKPCNHRPRCRLELEWLGDNAQTWQSVKEQCDGVKQEIVKPYWRCSKGCQCDGKQGVYRYRFASLMHWRNGCPRGGTWIKV